MAWSFWVMLASGQISLGNGAFMALGAYGSSVLTVKLGMALVPAVLAAALVTAGLGMLVGITAIRTRGIYLVMLTLGIGEIVQVVLINIPYIGGFRGFTGMRGTTVWVVVAAVAVIGFVLWRLMRSPIGKALEAVKADEMAAAAAGLDVVRVKLVAFGLGAFVAALAGGLYAHYILYIRPDQFNIQISIFAALYVIFGGTDNLLGPAVGAIVMTLLPEYIRPLQEWRVTFFGSVILLLIMFRPRGLITRSDLARVWWAVRRRPPDAPALAGVERDAVG
jgi:branched-chain amino acid transport system permease protein